MNTYLFSWNPVKWPWPNLEQDIKAVAKGKVIKDKWTCASHQKIQPGDRAFFVKVAHDPKGIFGSGYVVSKAFPEMSERTGKQVHRVNVVYDVLLNPEKNILTLDILEMSELRQQQWTPQSAGISIRPHLVQELEAVWKDFLNQAQIIPLNIQP